MAGIFTRKELAKILSDENLTPEERADQIFSLYGRSLDDGYITRGAAEAAQAPEGEQKQEAESEKAEEEKAQEAEAEENADESQESNDEQ